MKIVGHRGASGTALENTRESVRLALESGQKEIEIDVRLTSDGHFVVSHDPDFRRTAGNSLVIADSTLEQVQQVKLHNGETPPTLAEILAIVPKNSLIIEGKSAGWAKKLAAAIEHDHAKIHGVIAFNHAELEVFHKLCPTITAYPLTAVHGFRALKVAADNQLTGIGIGYWLLNPLLYRKAMRAGLDVYVYTVNLVWLARLLKLLYPNISVATNYPEKLAFLGDK